MDAPRPIFFKSRLSFITHYPKKGKIMRTASKKIERSKLYPVSLFIRRNLLLLLSVLSFAVISFDLSTELSQENNESEYFSVILQNTANPSNPQSIHSKKETEKRIKGNYFVKNTIIISSEFSEPYQSRPPPRLKI